VWLDGLSGRLTGRPSNCLAAWVQDLVDLVHVGGESLLQSLEKLHTSAERTRQRAHSTVKAMMEHSAVVSEGLHLVQQVRPLGDYVVLLQSRACSTALV
jgi:hypothetical protein